MADSILRLRVQSDEYDNKLKRATEQLTRYADGCRKAGGTLQYVDDGIVEFARSLGKMETSATTARGKLAEMTKAFTEWSVRYNKLTDEEKKGEFGKALSQSLDQLKVRIKEAQSDLKSITQELQGGRFGQFGGIIDGIGQKMGLTGSLTEMLTSRTALMTAGLGAAAAAIGKSTEMWAKYNAELARQDQQTTVITGLKGDDANRMTNTMRALSDTYKVDFRQAVEAANTLMSQFGESGDSAIQIIKDGMQGMIQGDGPKLLQMIQQYAPAFRDAGVSASQLVAVIQNSEGGLFTDQNMNAIVMGIKNIRLMTKQTGDALAQLGIDGDKMSKQLNDGTLTVFDALKQVSKQLQTVDSNSKTAGEVMQTVFGRQGAMAGTNLAKAIEQLNTNLDDTKKQTGEVGEAFAELQTANEKLNVAIREAFSYDGWEQMAAGIRASLITALAEVVGWLGKIREMLSGDLVDVKITPKPGIQNLADDPNVDDHGNYITKPRNNKPAPIKFYGEEESPKKVNPPKPTKSNTATTTKTPKTKEQLNNEEIQKLTQEYIKASDERQASIREEIKVLQDRNAIIQTMKDEALGKRLPVGDMDTASGIAPTELINPFEKYKETVISIKTPLQALTEEMKRLAEAQALALTPEQWSAYQTQIEEVQKKMGTFKGDGKSTAKEWGGAAQAINAVGSAMSSIEDPAAKVMGTIAQAIATIALTYAKSLEGTFTPWDWIAAAASGAATMISVISSIHSATGYANGGIVKGNSYSGDNIPAMIDGGAGGFAGLNAGEVVLNASMQNTLAQNLQGSGLQNLNVSGEISGETIKIVLNRYLKRSGQGEIVTW